MSNPHDADMVHRVDVLANAGAGKVAPGGGVAEDWRLIEGGASVPCLVTTLREDVDPQARDGRGRPEDVRRFLVAFTDPPADLGQSHRLIWDAPTPIGRRVLTVVGPLTPDPTGDLWTCTVEDRGPAPD